MPKFWVSGLDAGHPIQLQTHRHLPWHGAIKEWGRGRLGRRWPLADADPDPISALSLSHPRPDCFFLLSTLSSWPYGHQTKCKKIWTSEGRFKTKIRYYLGIFPEGGSSQFPKLKLHWACYIYSEVLKHVFHTGGLRSHICNFFSTNVIF